MADAACIKRGRPLGRVSAGRKLFVPNLFHFMGRLAAV